MAFHQGKLLDGSEGKERSEIPASMSAAAGIAIGPIQANRQFSMVRTEKGKRKQDQKYLDATDSKPGVRISRANDK